MYTLKNFVEVVLLSRVVGVVCGCCCVVCLITRGAGRKVYTLKKFFVVVVCVVCLITRDAGITRGAGRKVYTLENFLKLF